MKGTLYLVATPIGNLGDLSARAVQVLTDADFVAAEDTRVTRGLLSHLGLHKPLVSYYEQNRRESAELILPRLLEGESVALVTDAGTPAISDPGEELVRLCVEHGVAVVPVPGPCALVCALAASGLPTQRFCFEGFLAASGKSRREHLDALRDEMRTIVLYEAPHKLVRTLHDLFEYLGDRDITLCRELTKLHEEIQRGTITDALRRAEAEPPRGEYVLVIRGAPPQPEPTATVGDALSLLENYRLEGRSLKEAARLAARDTGYGKNELYDQYLEKRRL